MKCPDCDGETRVLETREKLNGTTRRRHECANGHRFTTSEALIDRKPGQRVILTCEAIGDELTNVWIDIYQPSKPLHRYVQNRNPV